MPTRSTGFALTHADDSAHVDAVAFDAAPGRLPIVATEEILTEFLTFFGGLGAFLRTKVLLVTRRILGDQEIRVLPQSHESFQVGLDLYAARLDKGL